MSDHSLPLIFIKLGGSVITNKEVPRQLRAEVLKRLIAEIVAALPKLSARIVVGHGSGSFGHVPAQQYQTMDGFVHQESRYGMAVTQDVAAELNRLVVHECIEQGLAAVSFKASNTLITDRRQLADSWLEVLWHYLESDLIPVTGGDVITDATQGCTILSTEQIFDCLVVAALAKGYQVARVIHVTEVSGVLDQDKKLISEITPTSFPKIQSVFTETKGFDVTGGMAHKVLSSLQLAGGAIESQIIDGLLPENLYNCLIGNSFIGTRIKSS